MENLINQDLNNEISLNDSVKLNKNINNQKDKIIQDDIKFDIDSLTYYDLNNDFTNFEKVKKFILNIQIIIIFN